LIRVTVLASADNEMQPQTSMSFMQRSIIITGISTLAFLPSAHAKRGNRLRTAAASDARSGSDTSGNAVLIPLQRMPARADHDGSKHHDASFYVGNITVGEPPQHLQVFFDTGSGHVLLPHMACKNRSCTEHVRYSPWASSSAMDVNANGSPVQEGNRLAKGRVRRTFATMDFTQADLGDGVAKGVLVRDHVCLSAGPEHHTSHLACADLAVLAALQEDAMPFESMPADGIIGLGLEGLSVSAFSNFYSRLMDNSHDVLPEFGMLLGETSGTILFGGRASVDNVAAPLEWFPVLRPHEGFWQFEIVQVRVNGMVVEQCQHGCRAVVDSGSSHLGVQSDRRESILNSLQSALFSDGKCNGPDLQIDLPRGLTLTLAARDYSDASCAVQLGALKLHEPQPRGVLFSLGTNVIRRYYTAFDWQAARIGFAPNEGSAPLDSNAHASAALNELVVF